MSDARWYRAEALLTPPGWLGPGYLAIDEDGIITAVQRDEPDAEAIESIAGAALPGMANLHSHAHQRALAGRAERVSAGGERDSFWTWRESMYALLARLGPDDLEAIAAQAYLEMLRAGYTSVGEFHYLHRAPDGAPYDDPAELSHRILAAGARTGIALTVLPSLYLRGGVDRPANEGQRRFLHESLDRFIDLIQRLLVDTKDAPLARVGLAPHSLRAVPMETLIALDEWRRRRDATMPVHIHVAEQMAEVEEVRAARGRSPVAWLTSELPLDSAWTLIHATHVTIAELHAMAVAGVTAGLCPETEANLGDGLYPLPAYQALGGRWGIGTDSNIRISVTGELRMLEYGQRLTARRRSIVLGPEEPHGSPGRWMVTHAADVGAAALAQPGGRIEPGRRADLIVLDRDADALAGHETATLLDAWVFAGGASAVKDVMVGGQWVIRDRRHPDEEAIAREFRAALERLRDT
jgi:formimidoylglutamate deiminase